MPGKFTLRSCVLILLLTASSTIVRSQNNIAGEKGYNSGWYTGLVNFTDPMMGFTEYQEVGQTFQSLISASVGTLEFYIPNFTNAGNVDIQIYTCISSTQWGSLLNTKTDVPINGPGWMSVDISSLNIGVSAGNYYGFKLIPKPGLNAGIGINSNLYGSGTSWVNNGTGLEYFDGGEDYPFAITGATALPVGLISLTAQKQANNILLQWSTASEQNTKSFTLQHSSDANKWKNAGTVAAAGNSNTIHRYTFLHTTPVKGNNYYRLLQTDKNEKYSYSETRTVKFNNDLPAFIVMANPVNNLLSIQVNKAITISLYNASGKLAYKKQLAPGIENIDISKLSKGMYFLKTTGITKKIMIQ